MDIQYKTYIFYIHIKISIMFQLSCLILYLKRNRNQRIDVAWAPRGQGPTEAAIPLSLPAPGSPYCT